MEARNAGFILAAYAATAIVFLALVLRAVLDGRAQRRALTKLGEASDSRRGA